MHVTQAQMTSMGRGMNVTQAQITTNMGRAMHVTQAQMRAMGRAMRVIQAQMTPRALRHVPLTPIPATAGSALATIDVSIYIPATAGN